MERAWEEVRRECVEGRVDHGVGRGCPTQIFKVLKSAVSRLDSSPKLSRGVVQLNQVLIDAARH